jgi:gliding motility-associated-like protein
MLVSGNLNIVNPSGQISSINGIEPGINLIEYSISNAHCVSRDTIQIQRFIPEPLVFAGNDTLICTNTFTLGGSEAFFGMGAWTVISGEALIEEPVNEASVLSILSDTLVLEWRVSNGVCPDVSDTVTIVRNTPDEIAQAMNDTIVCGLQFALDANAAIEANAWWQIVSGDAVIDDTSSAQSFVTAQEYGEQVFVWTLNDEGCVSRDTVAIQTLEAPYPVYAGEDQRLCQTTTILDAAIPVLGNGIWSTLAGGFFSDPTDPQSGFITPNAGFRALVWNVSNGNCVVRDTVYIDMIAVPVASGGPDLTGCALDTIQLQASLPPFGEGYWVLLSDNSRITDSLSNVSGFIADSSGNYYLRWKVVNDICSDSALVTISVLDSNDPDCIGNSNDIWVPEGFSPNGDGVFDKLEIVHNPNQQIELKIYDRRGVLLYQSDNYLNDWDGTSAQGTVLIEGRLPEGTYFYLVRAAGDTEYQKGYFTLWR